MEMGRKKKQEGRKEGRDVPFLLAQMSPAKNENLNSKSWAVLSKVEDSVTDRPVPSSARRLRQHRTHPILSLPPFSAFP